MLKRSLVAVAVVALLAVSVQAGEIKSHQWPCDYKFLEITSIPVFMDIGWYMKIKDQDKLEIVLVQDATDLHKFRGCVDLNIESNFAFELSCKINKGTVVPGDYACDFPVTNVGGVGASTIKVCAQITNANLANVTVAAGTKHVQVATVKIKVKPI